jgi:signal transduction histidine kinase/DNA-binding response OmpR family regulator
VQLKQDYGNLAKIGTKTFLTVSLAHKKLLAKVEPYQDKYGLNWLLVTVIPESDFMEEINANTKITILLCFFTFVIAIGFGLLITHWVTKPIKQLSQASKAIAQGEWQYENNQTNRIFNNQAITEINTFADSFYSMANQLKTILDSLENRVEQRTAELVIEKKKVEIANQAKSSFIANMSHELRSPLNAVIGFSQLMLRTKNLPKEQYENAGIIQKSGEYLLTLINNILDFSKIEAGKTILNQKDFDMDQLLDNLEDMLYLRAFDAGLELIFDRGDNLPRYIYTDGIKLRQILLNLLGNAIKFTQKGEVILSVRYDPPLLTENHFLQFTVKDTGKGISQEELSKLFEAFLQTESGKESQEGTGLGLVISRQFVQLMGGDIAVKSELNQGTTFDFSIQIKLGKETQESNKSTQRVLALAPDQPIYKILAVDDKPINCQLLVKLLTPLGFEVKEAANGQDAIAIWEAWEPHLIFMDMRMPVMDGYEATKYIKAQVKGSATAVVALTASVLEEEKVIVLSAGCDDFIRKPFKENMIFEALTKHLGVTYIYEQNQEQDHSSLETAKLSTKNFEIMPQQWLKQLSEAALEANTEEVVTLIGEISSTEIFLTQSLTKLVRKFEFEQILDLINPLLED